MDDYSEARMGTKHEERDSGLRWKMKWLIDSDKPRIGGRAAILASDWRGNGL